MLTTLSFKLFQKVIHLLPTTFCLLINLEYLTFRFFEWQGVLFVLDEKYLSNGKSTSFLSTLNTNIMSFIIMRSSRVFRFKISRLVKYGIH